jgi:hypothetical protein
MSGVRVLTRINKNQVLFGLKPELNKNQVLFGLKPELNKNQILFGLKPEIQSKIGYFFGFAQKMQFIFYSG